MYKDDIIAEVWRNREEYAAEHHHSLDEIVADLQLRQQQHQDLLVDRRPKKKTQEMIEPNR